MGKAQRLRIKIWGFAKKAVPLCVFSALGGERQIVYHNLNKVLLTRFSKIKEL